MTEKPKDNTVTRNMVAARALDLITAEQAHDAATLAGIDETDPEQRLARDINKEFTRRDRDTAMARYEESLRKFIATNRAPDELRETNKALLDSFVADTAKLKADAAAAKMASAADVQAP